MTDGPDDGGPAPGTEILGSRLPAELPPVCPVCAAPRPTEGRFCERCGADVTLAPPAGARWVAEIIADRQLFDRIASDGLQFPEGRDARSVPMLEAELLIGRRHEGRGIDPAIDLSGPLADPAASHRHAVLTRLDDGGYTITDVGSTNGTEVDGGHGRTALEPGQPCRLARGDRIHIGAWTTIVVRRVP